MDAVPVASATVESTAVGQCVRITAAGVGGGAWARAGGSKVEDEDAVAIDVGVVEPDGVRQVDAEFARQAMAANELCPGAV